MPRRLSATILLGALSLATLETQAEPQPNAQWRAVETSFFDLIQNGYTIAAVTSLAARSTGLPQDTYVLQKNNSVFRCVETRAAEAGTTRTNAPLRCAELVKPYMD